MLKAVLLERARTRERAWLAPVALGLALAAYNNLLFGLPGDLSFPPAWIFYPRAVLIPLLAVAWAVRARGLDLADMGITTAGWGRSAAVGLGAAAVVAVPAILYFTFPLGVSEGSIDYDRPTFDSTGNFIFWALVRYPVNAAIFEEVMFRGVLLALAMRAFGARGGVAFSAVPFALWHIVVNHTTMDDTNVAESAAFLALAELGALAALFVGGLIMGEMRRRTGNLAGPIAFHWLAVVAMNAALFAQSG